MDQYSCPRVTIGLDAARPRFLSPLLANTTIVGLGEASHGTHEFYVQKRRIVQYLVSQNKYRLLALEAPAHYIEPINQYIQTGQGDLLHLLQSMGLYNTDELYKLCQWLKAFNDSHSAADQVKMIGFDEETFWGDPLTRDQNMATQFIQSQQSTRAKSIVWGHNLHVAKDTTMTQYRAMGFHLHKQYASRYYVIGLDTYQGSVSVLNEGTFESHSFSGQENTFSALFAQGKYRDFFINFHDAPNPLLNTRNSITNLYSNWQEPKPLPIRAGVDFDGLVFIRETTASKPNPPVH